MNRMLLLPFLMVSLAGCWKTQDGEKVGTIVKFAREGIIISTWEGELIRGGMNDGSGSFGKSFHFTVEKKELVQTAKDALEHQKPVQIKYHHEAFTLPWRSDSSDYFLDDIKVIKK